LIFPYATTRRMPATDGASINIACTFEMQSSLTQFVDRRLKVFLS
jgi:hypothetical protein